MSLLLAPWTRLSLLVVLLVAAGVCVLLYEPQRILSEGWPPGFPVGAAVLLFAAGYGVCAAAFVPRPLLNLAAGAVFGTQFGLLAAVGGTVLGAAIAFGLGRIMGQEALRPYVRGRWLQAADGQLSRHGFRSMLAVRLFPGMPFVVANYCAAVSRCGWLPFLGATALGVVPNTAAYVIAGASASSPARPRSSPRSASSWSRWWPPEWSPGASGTAWHPPGSPRRRTNWRLSTPCGHRCFARALASDPNCPTITRTSAPRHELVRIPNPRSRPGAYGVPPDLLQRPPAADRGVRRLRHDPGAAFTAITQIGTEAAVLIYFRKDIARIVSTWFRSLYTSSLRSEQDAKMGWLVIVGSIPIGVLGLAFKDQIEGPFRDLRLTATTLIVMGVVLGVADRLAARDEEGGRHRAVRERKTLKELGVKDGLIFGVCQAMALIPGVSRSGATISGGLLLGFTREAAARYSFLLAIPAVLASGVFEIKDVVESPGHISWGPTIFATVIAFFVGYVVIAWFMKFISTKSFMPFVIYRIVLGVALFILIGTDVLSPHAGESGS